MYFAGALPAHRDCCWPGQSASPSALQALIGTCLLGPVRQGLRGASGFAISLLFSVYLPFAAAWGVGSLTVLVGQTTSNSWPLRLMGVNNTSNDRHHVGRSKHWNRCIGGTAFKEHTSSGKETTIMDMESYTVSQFLLPESERPPGWTCWVFVVGEEFSLGTHESANASTTRKNIHVTQPVNRPIIEAAVSSGTNSHHGRQVRRWTALECRLCVDRWQSIVSRHIT